MMDITDVRLLLRNYNYLKNNDNYLKITYLIDEALKEAGDETASLVKELYFKKTPVLFYCGENYLSQSGVYRKMRKFCESLLIRILTSGKTSDFAKETADLLRGLTKSHNI